ncbi:MAG TPA: type II CAAX endopeptidase family protein [Sphingomonas sp.]|uniref:CPBP family intramembrane glutamic endopeptidase n=1 Tax=Sphingomonas sp. TaxID=28214 RepID=UPI002BF9E87E|nr:type II CAAX endopeptidase family protein [Sphingomonas sp.]HMI18532.1 type II CAAX endopeptidase family protein [Sphingomonas sp.]
MARLSPTPPGRLAAAFARISHWAVARLVLFILVLIAVLILSKVVTNPLIPPAASVYHRGAQMAANLASAGLLLVAYAWTVRLIERRRAIELAIGPGVAPFLIGSLIGVALMAAVYLTLDGLGLVAFAPGTGFEGLVGGLVAFFAAAVLEELVTRAVIFRIVEEAAGTTIGIAVSAILFGLLHAFNPGATIISTAAIAIEAGGLLAVAYALTRNIWLVVGLHMAWNFTEGNIFGAQVSGESAPHSLLRTTLSGPQFLTGGAFGPEASIVSVIVCLAAAVVIGALVMRRRGWQPRRLRLYLP